MSFDRYITLSSSSSRGGLLSRKDRYASFFTRGRKCNDPYYIDKRSKYLEGSQSKRFEPGLMTFMANTGIKLRATGRGCSWCMLEHQLWDSKNTELVEKKHWGQ